MEKPKTLTEQRLAKTEASAAAIIAVADTALRDIDAVLAQEDEFWTEHRTIIEQNGCDIIE